MNRHGMYRKDIPVKPSKMPVHPIWRGIGLIMVVVLPVGSYLLSNMLINNKESFNWLIIPQDIVLNKYTADPLILVRILYALVILFLVGAILAFVTFLAASIFGPSRYDPYDVPPEKIRKS